MTLSPLVVGLSCSQFLPFYVRRNGQMCCPLYSKFTCHYVITRRLDWVRQMLDVVLYLLPELGIKIGHIYITKKLTEKDTSNRDSLMTSFV